MRKAYTQQKLQNKSLTVLDPDIVHQHKNSCQFKSQWIGYSLRMDLRNFSNFRTIENTLHFDNLNSKNQVSGN